MAVGHAWEPLRDGSRAVAALCTPARAFHIAMPATLAPSIGGDLDLRRVPQYSAAELGAQFYLIWPAAHSAHSRRMALKRRPYSRAIRP